MKIRTDFVTNSSSSGFVAIKVESNTLDSLLNETELTEKIFSAIEDHFGCENGSPYSINTSVAKTVCNLIFAGGMPYISAYADVTSSLKYNSHGNMDSLLAAVENALAKIADIEPEDDDDKEDATRYKRILQLIKLICENKDKIDADATATIESGSASSDSGGPDFSYSELSVKNGRGTYLSYSVFDDYYGNDDNPSPLYKWAKENDYYDPENERPGFAGGYDESFYFDPPYHELAETYEDVKRIQIGEPADSDASRT